MEIKAEIRLAHWPCAGGVGHRFADEKRIPRRQSRRNCTEQGLGRRIIMIMQDSDQCHDISAAR